MRYLGLILRLGFVLLVLILLAFWKELRATPKQPSQAIPDIWHYTNPHSYQLGRITGINLVSPEKGKVWTVISWSPSYAPMLYSESLLFCGDARNKLINLTNGQEVVIIYSRAVETARIPEGPPPHVIACHSLDAVRLVQKPDYFKENQ